MPKNVMSISKQPIYEPFKLFMHRNVIKSMCGQLLAAKNTYRKDREKSLKVYLFPTLRGLQTLAKECGFDLEISIASKVLIVSTFVAYDDLPIEDGVKHQIFSMYVGGYTRLSDGVILPSLSVKDLLDERIYTLTIGIYHQNEAEDEESYQNYLDGFGHW